MVVAFMQKLTTYCLRTPNHLSGKLLHVAVPCGAANSATRGGDSVPVPSQWEGLKSGEKTVALWSLGSMLVGGFLLKFYSKKASGSNMAEQSEPPPILVIAGPSGSGKSTLLKRMFDKYPDKFAFSVSHTTRQPRKGETNGKDYYFTTCSKMKSEIEHGKFIEWAEFSGNTYGTSIESVKRCQSDGKVCVLDIDMQGVRSIKKTELSTMYVHIKPPSMEVLEYRLRARKTDTEEAILKRLETAKGELEDAAKPGMFDYIIVNDDLDNAFKSLDDMLSKSFGFKDS